MTEVNGWHLPSGDSYFPKFVQGTPPKQNGFQRDHLLEAFKHVKRWKVAIDVGAHVGFWTRDMAERFSTVHAFEPAADTFDCLKRNMLEFSNVELNNCAVGMWVGKCLLKDDPERPGNTGSRFINPTVKGDTKITALDALNLKGCDLLKVDVEGYEFHVLKGAEQLILKHRPVVIMECDKKFAQRYETANNAAMIFLLERGYQEVARLHPDRIFACSANPTRTR